MAFAAPAAKPDSSGLRLAFFGDSGTGNTDQKAVARQLRRLEDDLRHVFLLGDNVYWSGRSDRFEAAFHRVYRRYLGAVDESGRRRIAFHAALGNHDAHDCERVRGEDGRFPRNADAYGWRQPRCDVAKQLGDPAFGYPNGERYYRVDLSDAYGEPLGEVFVIDTNTLASAKHPERHDAAQLEWLAAELAASRERGDAADRQPWRIITMHRPLHTPGSRGYAFGRGGHEEEPPFLTAMSSLLFGGEAELGADRELHDELEGALAASDIDAIFAGHNHFYARLRPPGDPIRYFVSGGGGIAVYEPELTSPEVVTGGGFHHFVTVVLTHDRFEYCVIDSLGRTRDDGSWSRHERDRDDERLDPDRKRAVCRG